MADKIVDSILKLETVDYIHKGEVSPECKNIVRGNAIETFGKLLHLTNKKDEMVSFIKQQLENDRPKVKKQALRFMREIEKKTSI